MSVRTAQIMSPDMVVAELEALTSWYTQVVRHCVYAESHKLPAEAHPPSTLLLWCKQQAEKGLFNKKNVEALTLSYEALSESARVCMSAAPPTLSQYNALGANLETYIRDLHRLQQDLVEEGSKAVDLVTGLRTASGMRADLQREHERFERKGASFSIAHIAIDHLAELQSKYDLRSRNIFYAHLAQSISETVRSFDDVYYLGKGEFIVVLKHVDFIDAGGAMDRLRHHIRSTFATLKNGEQVNLTASFGVAEALPKESSELLLQHAKDALQQARRAGGNCICEFREMSAFDTFVKEHP